MRSLGTILILTSLLAFAHPAGAVRVDGLKTPESFLIDPVTGHYYISNVNGKPLENDGNGFITKLDPSGNAVNLEFILSGRDGVTLNAPKGLLIAGNFLYVTDIDAVKRFDKETGKFLGTIDFSLLGVRFLNDLAMDGEGKIYVSDMLGDAVYRFDPSSRDMISVVAKNHALGNPNGLLFDAPRNRLLVAAWGTGEILGLTLDGKITPLVRKVGKNLDGIDFDREGNILVSSFTGGEIYRIRQFSRVEVIRKNLVTPADISFDYRHNQILVPSFDGNVAFSLPLK
ncbi:MAG: hypothetical protein COV67_10665 [Nitrospinae bacterium CG11_big_fil_rev_8_21_14_0_20_56_8]|nr:MAG: hypothetical protein COV67_10665 [Nitrospinae bacterium CG11_big_fil_rev_8_21_14_0_20_56_8]